MKYTAIQRKLTKSSCTRIFLTTITIKSQEQYFLHAETVVYNGFYFSEWVDFSKNESVKDIKVVMYGKHTQTNKLKTENWICFPLSIKTVLDKIRCTQIIMVNSQCEDFLLPFVAKRTMIYHLK